MSTFQSMVTEVTIEMDGLHITPVTKTDGKEAEWDTTDMAYRPNGLSMGQDKNICDSSSQTSVTQNISNKLKEKNCGL